MKKTEYEVGAKVSVVRALTYLPNTAGDGSLGVSGGEL